MLEIKSIQDRTKILKDKFKNQNEQLRISELKNCISVLKKFLYNKPNINLYLFGSITQANQFTQNSDVDIAIGNFNGSRLDIYLELEELFNRKIDLILLEKCSFGDEIINKGIKIQ